MHADHRNRIIQLIAHVRVSSIVSDLHKIGFVSDLDRRSHRLVGRRIHQVNVIVRCAVELVFRHVRVLPIRGKCGVAD
jgi:hypothetical protein